MLIVFITASLFLLTMQYHDQDGHCEINILKTPLQFTQAFIQVLEGVITRASSLFFCAKVYPLGCPVRAYPFFSGAPPGPVHLSGPKKIWGGNFAPAPGVLVGGAS